MGSVKVTVTIICMRFLTPFREFISHALTA